MEEKQEQLGLLIDRLDNFSHALQLQIPPHIHVETLRGSLPELVAEMKTAFIELTGENPWE